MSTEKLADALFTHSIISTSTPEARAASQPFVYATWVGAESVDSALSTVRLADGTLIPGCPKLKGATGLVPGATLLCANPGTSMVLTILDSLEGDITLYEAS